MAVKIRLTRVGKKEKPFYRVVVCDSKAPRGGRHIDQVGTYDPLQEPSEIKLDLDKVRSWLSTGAQPTVTVRRLLQIKGFYSEPKQDTVNVQS